ncbi:MAG: hypothetical protein LBR26_15325 [Prevotella sp.]|jgi:hypothetical protein|nr:hypothetical protein [Prevotella sp.]
MNTVEDKSALTGMNILQRDPIGGLCEIIFSQDKQIHCLKGRIFITAGRDLRNKSAHPFSA